MPAQTTPEETPQAEAPAAAEAKPAKPRRSRKPAEPKPEPTPATPAFEWPKPAQQVLLDYLTSEVSDRPDAPNHAKPFIDRNGVLRLHSSDWRSWLIDHGMAPSKAEAARPLREAGLTVRPFSVPGESRSLGMYTGPAPKGTDKLPRRIVQRGGGGDGRRAGLARLSAEQLAYLRKLLAKAPKQGTPEREAHDQLVGMLPADEQES
jgi:hypothetical protein